MRFARNLKPVFGGIVWPFSAAVLALGLAVPALAETVDVKYFGAVDLDGYHCTDTVSSFVHRICFDEEAAHVVVLLRGTYYAYCRIDAATVNAWLAADSKGRFYNQNVKSDAVAGRFACN